MSNDIEVGDEVKVVGGYSDYIGAKGVVQETLGGRLVQVFVDKDLPSRVKAYHADFNIRNLEKVSLSNQKQTKSTGIQSEVEDRTVMNNPGDPGLYKCTLNDSTYIVLTGNDCEFGTIVYSFQQDKNMTVGDGMEMIEFDIVAPFEGKVTLSNG